MSIKVTAHKTPNCPYRHIKCVNYNSFSKQGVCQTHGNRYSKSIRCCLLPSWVKDGYHLAVLNGGHLHV